MNKKTKAIQDSIAHWERMIAYVKTLDKEQDSNRHYLKDKINEAWLGYDCPLCTLYEDDCSTCPLYNYEQTECDDEDSLWQNVNDSTTWGDWIVNANRMLNALKAIYSEN